MARCSFFSHTGPSGLTPNDRARAANLRTHVQAGNYEIDGLGENLFPAHLYYSYVRHLQTRSPDAIRNNWKTVPELAHESVQLWMESPLNRKNLMRTIYSSGKMGIAFDRNSTIFITCSFSVVDNAALAAN